MDVHMVALAWKEYYFRDMFNGSELQAFNQNYNLAIHTTHVYSYMC